MSIETLKRELDEALDARAAEWPYRRAAFDRMNERIEAFFDDLCWPNVKGAWQPDSTVVAECDDLFERPLFICGSMKSGTTLLAQLLDGHPKLFVLPGDTHFRQDWSRMGLDGMARHWVRRMITPTGLPPFWFLGSDAAVFEDFLGYLHWFHERRCGVRADVLDALKAIYAARPGRTEKEVYWVEKTPENEREVNRLLSRFPKARFCHIVREISANYAALKAQSKVLGWPFLGPRVLASLVAGVKRGERNRRRLGRERYLIIAYEDLVADARAIMSEVAAFLDIEFDEALLTPTSGGKEAMANSMYATDRVLGQIVTRETKTEAPAAGTAEQMMIRIARSFVHRPPNSASGHG